MHPVLVYNLLIVSAFWLSGVATYLLVERLTGSARAAFVAGLIYATYSYRFDHYSHLELQMTYWMPLGLLALHLFISTGRWRYALALALAGVAQLYSGMYYSVFFLVYVVVITIGLLIAQRPSLRALIVPGVVSALVAAILARTDRARIYRCRIREGRADGRGDPIFQWAAHRLLASQSEQCSVERPPAAVDS